MLFNSLVFLVFAALFFSGWSFFRKTDTSRWIYILVFSLFFYGWWDWRFIFLILLTGGIDYFAALAIENYPQRKKLFLIISIIANVGTLVLFKYSSFIAFNLDSALAGIGIKVSFSANVPKFLMIVPVGLSFYTFQSLSYMIDVYRGQFKATKNVLHFFAAISLFPHLVAGPIVRASDLLPQLKKWTRLTEPQQWNGFKLIIFGFFKKMVIADNLAPTVNTAFSATTLNPSAPYWWLIMTAFALQIYCDFSGYTDIARGLAQWMGYSFKLNFNHPYTAASLRDFWSKWHISLSHWFRDYVYIPLGGGKKGLLKSLLFLWITMLISGLWHGAAWGFVIWGAVHAVFLSFERLTHWPEKLSQRKLGHLLCWGIVMVQVWTSWVFFRANNLVQASTIIKTMYGFNWHFSGAIENSGFVYTLILGVLGYEFIKTSHRRKQLFHSSIHKHRKLEFAVLITCILLIIYKKGPGSEFIYFQF